MGRRLTSETGSIAIHLANVMAHEIGHDLGSIHLRDTSTSYILGGVMGSAEYTNLAFSDKLKPAIKFALGLPVDDSEFKAVYDYYDTMVELEAYAFNNNRPAGHDDEALRLDAPWLVVFNGAVAVDSSLPDLISDVDFGSTIADGTDGQDSTVSLYIFNDGDQDLNIISIELVNGALGFSLEDVGPLPIVLPPLDPDNLQPELSTQVITVSFDPTSPGSASDVLRMESDTLGGEPVEIPLQGLGVSSFGDITLEVGNNNLGGLALSADPLTAEGFATIKNIGAGPLTITDVLVSKGVGQFEVGGLPANFGSESPLILAPGGSFDLDMTFNPDRTGLQPGEFRIISDDPETPDIRRGVVGTGVADDGTALDYGNDFVAVETPFLPDSRVLRQTSDDQGNWQFVLAPEEGIHYVVFDPVSGLVAHGYDVTASSGQPTPISAPVFLASVEPDTDGDGLPDDTEFAVGTSPAAADTDGDGLSDFVEAMQGLDPFGGRALPTGIIARLTLDGNAQEVVVEGSTQIGAGQIAYIATSKGLAIVDTLRFDNPILLSQLDLPGDSHDVGVDTSLGIAVLPSGKVGVHLVDISDPVSPVLVKTVPLPEDANRVEVVDGVAYVASGTSLLSIDLSAGEVVQTLDFGTGELTDIAREGRMLYTIDDHSIRALRAIQISGSEMEARGLLRVPAGAGRLFVGNGIAYVLAATFTVGGFATVDVTDPEHMTLIRGPDPDARPAPRTAIVANGSGVGLLIGTPSDTRQNVVDVVDLTDPAGIDILLDRLELPGTANSVFIANGIGYVVGRRGLQVINYLPFDNQGQSPEVTLGSPVSDLDPDSTGIQVTEGSLIPLRVGVSDDVQVRNVELLVDGEVIRNDGSFPFDFRAIDLGNDPTEPTVEVQVRATDTGGNSTLSDDLVLDLVADIFGPVIDRITPPDGTEVFLGIRTVRVRFSEPLAAETVVEANFQLRDPAGDTVNAQSVDLRNNRQTVRITYEPLTAVGTYTLVIAAPEVTDRAGNATGVEPVP